MEGNTKISYFLIADGNEYVENHISGITTRDMFNAEFFNTKDEAKRAAFRFNKEWPGTQFTIVKEIEEEYPSFVFEDDTDINSAAEF